MPLRDEPAFAEPASLDLLLLYPSFPLRLYFSQSRQTLSYLDALSIWNRHHRNRRDLSSAAGKSRHPRARSRARARVEHPAGPTDPSGAVGLVVPERPQSKPYRRARA